MRWLWPRMQRVSPVVAAPWGASAFDTISASKKSLYAAEQQRADVARARRRWIREQGLLDPARAGVLVATDRTAPGEHHQDRRRHAGPYRGQRARVRRHEGLRRAS